MSDHIAAITVFFCSIAAVSIIGFVAARWQSGSSLSLQEWALAGRRFGTLMSWFLIGGDLYTAYTFIAIPALVYGTGAMGFYGVPYTILIYPLIFAVMPRLWSVCREHGYVTAADFVAGVYGHRPLSVAVAVTGIFATMPYIALQLLGIQVVISALGFPADGLVGKLPLAFAFLTVAAYTYTSGLRAPAMIAVAKDILIYVTIFVAMAIIPAKLGGFTGIFARIPATHLLLAPASAASTGGATAYASLALGSAIALIFYPHSLTAMLSAQSRATIRRNAVFLPAYSLLLGFLALLGFMAVAAHVGSNPAFVKLFAQYHANFAVPALFLTYFPDWFCGVAFAAIAIGALVPAAIMAISAANLFTRSVYPLLVRSMSVDACEESDAQEARVARWSSLAVLLGGFFFNVALPTTYAVQLQLLGGVWIIQTAPAVLFGLFVGWYDGNGIFAGWLVGIILGTLLTATQQFSPIWVIPFGAISMPIYIAVVALVANLATATIVSGSGRLGRGMVS